MQIPASLLSYQKPLLAPFLHRFGVLFHDFVKTPLCFFWESGPPVGFPVGSEFHIFSFAALRFFFLFVPPFGLPDIGEESLFITGTARVVPRLSCVKHTSGFGVYKEKVLLRGRLVILEGTTA